MHVTSLTSLFLARPISKGERERGRGRGREKSSRMEEGQGGDSRKQEHTQLEVVALNRRKDSSPLTGVNKDELEGEVGVKATDCSAEQMPCHLRRMRGVEV